MKADVEEEVQEIVANYDATAPAGAAEGLRALWLRYEPVSMAGIKAEEREQQETVGIPVPVLDAIGKAITKVARSSCVDFMPLCRLLWERFGREGRAVAVLPLGGMALAAPEEVLPILRELCRSCFTWEDADRLAMGGLEPIVRKDPERWLEEAEAWIADENKWVRRAGITVAGRLPMKRAEYTARCLGFAERLLEDESREVRKALSFAIRLAARGDVVLVREFLERNVPPTRPKSTWVLCDAVRSMTKKFLPELSPLKSRYEDWLEDPSLSNTDRRSIESAVRTLEEVHP
jgi:3-methyladenine DNA glycosylase AlkD